MLLFGRLSRMIVCPLVKVAVLLPPFAAGRVQVQLLPSVVLPATSLVFESVKSGPVTITVSVAVLLVSSLSVTKFDGSTFAIPPPRGLTNEPTFVGVAAKVTWNEPGAAMLTAPVAVHVRLLEAIAQLMLALPVTLVNVPAVGTP